MIRSKKEIWHKYKYKHQVVSKGTKMSKNYSSGKKSSFSQKKRNLTEMEELEENGVLDMLSNRQKLYSKVDINFEDEY